MLGNSFIDVAIGLVLMYLVLSMVCTAVNEAIATAVNLRARTLASGLKALIDDPSLHDALLGHGIVAGPSAVTKPSGASHVPPTAAGTAPAATVPAATGGQTAPSGPGFFSRALNSLRQPGPSYIDPRNFAVALLDCLDPEKPIPGLAEAKKAAEDLTLPSNIKDVLVTITARAGGDITKARDDLANWFDSSMDRLSGVYKRKVALLGFIVALTLTAAVNADSVNVARALWLDPGLRDQIAAVAKGTAGTGQAQTDTSVPALAARAQQNLRNLESVRAFPLGWSKSDGRLDKNWHRSPGGWLKKALGLLITALALTLGAPFWFDALSSFVRLRGAGNPPAPATKPA